MSGKSIDQLARDSLPNLAGTIIAGSCKVLAISTKCAISQWLLMRAQLQTQHISSATTLVVRVYS